MRPSFSFWEIRDVLSDRFAGCPSQPEVQPRSGLAESAEDAPYSPNDEAAAAVAFQS